mmetsp:Transcript_33356/g.30321  ORF Transcript_33356/g.30321 Transcript_33356/m.30321 type:complete len:187 (-) Transcript_33356:942-1502(-)
MIILKRPYDKTYMFVFQIIWESLLLIYLIGYFMLSILDQTENYEEGTRDAAGYIIFAASYLLVCANLVFILYEMIALPLSRKKGDEQVSPNEDEEQPVQQDQTTNIVPIGAYGYKNDNNDQNNNNGGAQDENPSPFNPDQSTQMNQQENKPEQARNPYLTIGGTFSSPQKQEPAKSNNDLDKSARS